MIKENNNIDNLKLSLNNTFLDYFYIFGLNSETILSNDLYNYNQYEGEHDKIRPSLISKFPPFNKTKSNIDENIILQHCFPIGFKLIEHVCPPKNEIYHFSLDNLKNDNNKIYFTCLLFYERLSLYYEYKKYYDMLNSDFYLDIEENDINFKLNQSIVNNEYHSKKLFKDDDAISSHSLDFNNNNQFKREQNLRLNEIVTTRLSFTSKRKTLKLLKENFFSSIYIPKVICLSSKIPFPQEKSILLNLILNYILNNNEVKIPIEKIIESIMLEIPFPPKGIISFNYTLNNTQILIKQTPINRIQIYSYKMHYIFCFSVKNIIFILKCILLEYPILFFSKNKEKLSNIIETFILLLFPFKYQYPYISILPNLNTSMIENEKCFIFGINQLFNKKKEASIFESFNIKLLNKYILICDIDNRVIYTKCDNKDPLKKINLKDLKSIEKKDNNQNDEIILSQEINTENHESINHKIKLPEHYTSKFRNRLEELLKNPNLKIDCNSNEYNEKICIEITNIFFYYIMTLIMNYNNYLYNYENKIKEICERIKTKTITLNDMWNIKEFNNNIKNEEKEFYNCLINTKIFKNFLERKYYHQNGEKELEFLFLDQQIVLKKNKNFFSRTIKTFFVNSNTFEHKLNKNISPKINIFSNEENDFILNNEILLSKYFQKYNKQSFHYFFFPKLLYDNIFFEKKYYNMELNYPSTEYYNDYNNLIKNVLSLKEYREFYNGLFIKQYHYIDLNQTYPNEIADCIFIIWLRFFSMTFYYIDFIEKKILFYEMLNNLKKVNFIDNQTLSLLYNSIYKYGTDTMLIKFYNTIKHNYIHYSYLTNKLENNKMIKKPISKKFSISTSDKYNKYIIYYKQDENKQLFELTNDIIKNLKKRTFKEENKEIKFQINIECPYCKNRFALMKIITSFELMNKKNKMFFCPIQNCNKEISPEIKVKYGENIIEKIKIYSPWYILNFYCSELLEENGLKLNLKKLRKNKTLFWNCILYFTIKGLNIDILLEYKDNNISKKENSFNYNICDYLNQENENEDINENNYNNNKKFTDCLSFKNIEIEQNVINF